MRSSGVCADRHPERQPGVVLGQQRFCIVYEKAAAISISAAEHTTAVVTSAIATTRCSTGTTAESLAYDATILASLDACSGAPVTSDASTAPSTRPSTRPSGLPTTANTAATIATVDNAAHRKPHQSFGRLQIALLSLVLQAKA